MRKRREVSEPDSFFSQAKMDEPIFVLRGSDELAPELVEAWVSRFKASVKELDEEDEALVEKVLDTAQEMRQWKKDRFDLRRKQ